MPGLSNIRRFLTEEDHEFSAENTLLLVLILCFCILIAYVVKKYKLYMVPESGAALVVGLIVGLFARLLFPNRDEMNFLSFDPELFFFLLLPPIIFEAGYTLRKRQFFSNFWTISGFAVGGTLVSTFAIGYLVFLLGKAGWVDIDTSSPMEALLFGSLISAVDPVATLSILGAPELRCKPLLYALVFGESVLNDVVSIVLFRTFYNFYKSGHEFTSHKLVGLMTSFLTVSLASVCIGILLGLSLSYICKNTNIRDYPHYEISLLFLVAYGSYAFPEVIQLSGIMSLFFCGIVLSHYNTHNLSDVAYTACEAIFKTLASFSEFMVFLYMGMGVFTGGYSSWSGVFVFFTLIFCFLGRLLNTFPFSFLANIGRTNKIPFKMQVVIWFSGLRGAIAFALSMNMPSENRDLYVSTTLSIVIMTTIACGGLTEKLLDRMGMKRSLEEMSLEDEDEDEGGYEFEFQEYMSEYSYWKKLDDRYLKPIFGGRKKGDKKRKPVALSPSSSSSSLEHDSSIGTRGSKREPFLKRRAVNEEESEGLLGFEMKSTGSGKWHRQQESDRDGSGI